MFGETEAFGNAFTVTVEIAAAVHPFAAVTVTVYIVVAAGLTVMDAVVAPVFHPYVPPPDAVIVALCPVQMFAFPEKAITGRAFTFITDDALFVHPFPSVTTTEYAEAAVGLTVMLGVVAPVLHA